MEVVADLAAERATLAAPFKFGYDAYIEVADIVQNSSYSNQSNETLWKCIDYFFRKHGEACKQIDVPSVMSAATDLGIGCHFEKESELAHLRGILNFKDSIKLENVRRLAAKIRKIEIADVIAKKLNETSAELKNVTGDESASEILGIAENKIFDLSCLFRGLDVNGPQLIGTGLRDYIQYLAENEVDQVGISSGYKIWDATIGGGFRNGAIDVVGARRKVGKSNYAVNVVNHVAGKLNIPCLYLDTELNPKYQQIRLLSMVSGVKIKRIETGKFAKDSEEKRKVFKAIDFIEKMPYHHICIAGQGFEDTISEMRRWLVKNVGFEGKEAKPCLIVFDYIKLMDDKLLKNLQEYQAIGFMMTGLHNFVTKYMCPCLAFIQLNRDGDIAQSDRVGWFCSSFSVLKLVERNSEEDTEIPTELGINRTLSVPISRYGEGLGNGDYINFRADFSVSRLIEHSTRSTMNNSSFTFSGNSNELSF